MTGTLIAIGGALDSSGPIARRFLEESGGLSARIVIIPTASGRADAGEEVAAGLKNLGLEKPAAVLPVHNREDACRPDLVACAEQASGIFFTGGTQLRLTAALGGTPLLAAILAANKAGSVVAGTSAGAAALTTLMIAEGRSGSLPRPGMARLAPGLGFINQIIFDQHFSQRNRLGRMLLTICSQPGLIGIGLDENTAAVISGSQLEAAGTGAITILDGQHLSASDISEVAKDEPVALSGMHLHILKSGCTFDLRTRTAVIPIKFSEHD